ncbi:MAG: DUF5658 family protein [Phycisphaerae bacterium]|jgi:hypothetical protein
MKRWTTAVTGPLAPDSPAPLGNLQAPPAPAPEVREAPPRDLSWHSAFRPDQIQIPTTTRRPGRLSRAQRVLLVLLAVWILNVFDLGFTLHQARTLHFIELNPLAAKLLNHPPLVLFAYKFSLLGLGTAILAWLRRHAIAELGCWLLLASYLYVAVRWHVYYEHVFLLPIEELPT